jgi:predicted nucleic acid-binding protein
MSVLVLDTNVVSILFNRHHSLWSTCAQAVAGNHLVISFMTRAELLLWPTANDWGPARRSALERHMALYLTLYPDEHTCLIWVALVDACRRKGHTVQTADAWIAAAALQFGCPVVTTDFKDYSPIGNLNVVPIR